MRDEPTLIQQEVQRLYRQGYMKSEIKRKLEDQGIPWTQELERFFNCL